MGVKLRKRKGANGTYTFGMDINHNGQRWYETIKGYKLVNSISPLDKQKNKEMLKIIESHVYKRAMDLNNSINELKIVKGNDVLVLEWMAKYISDYKKKDLRNIEGATNRFKNFLDERGIKRLTFKGIDELLIESFIDYLQEHSIGSGAVSYYKRFTKMILHAYRSKMMSVNVLDFVTKKPKGRVLKKDFLTLDEIEVLTNTPTSALEVKRAFLFCCNTGMAWVDVKSLKWSDVKDGRIEYIREKTKGEPVVVHLNIDAINLLGKTKEGLVFKLPTPDGANASLKDWVTRAKIEKKITWHNARHSFGTNLILKGADIYTTANVLGHTDLKNTQMYVQNAKLYNSNITDLLNKK